MNVQLRLETEADYSTVEYLTKMAFWNLHVPGCDEHYLVHVMRSHQDFRKDLAFVAECEGKVIGNIMYTRSRLEANDGKQLETLTFGPVSVLPEFQRKGVGKKLITHTLDIVKKEGCPAVAIFGNPANYVGSGFKCCKTFNVCMEGGKTPAALLVLAIRPEALSGHTWTFRESEVFQIDRQAAADFDAGFPSMKKEYQRSQELFHILSNSFVE